MVSPPPPEQQHQCRLLKLPPELRNRIYYAVSARQEDLPVKVYDGNSFAPSLELLQTCRQIYVEASLTPFERNRLHFVHPLGLALFVRTVSPDKLAAARSLTITLTYQDYPHGGWALLRKLPNLKSLQIKADIRRVDGTTTALHNPVFSKVLGSLEGLQELHVLFCDSQLNSVIDLEEECSSSLLAQAHELAESWKAAALRGKKSVGCES